MCALAIQEPTDLSEAVEPTYKFSEFELAPDGTLKRGVENVHLTPKEVAILRLLLTRPGQVVTAAALQKAAWNDTHVTGDSLPKCISSLRAALAPSGCIQTVYKRGYRMTCAVTRLQLSHRSPQVRLAILPFSIGAHVPEHMGHTVSEELITRLTIGQMRGLVPFSILARDSVFVLAQHGREAREIGIMLGADFVLTGTLQATNLHYRLRAEMIRVEDATQVWVEDYIVSNSMASGVEHGLIIRLSSRFAVSDPDGVIASGTDLSAGESLHRLQAYNAFHKGHFQVQGLQSSRVHDGLQELVKASELDPTLTAAQIDLINACVAQAFYGFLQPSLAAQIAKRAAHSFTKDNRGLDAVAPSIGWIQLHFDRNHEQALKTLERSAGLPLEPGNVRAWTMAHLSRGAFHEAVALTERALRSDPYSPWLHARLAWIWHLAGEKDQSRKRINEALSIAPEHEACCIYGSAILAYLGEAERAAELAGGLAHRSTFFDLAVAAKAYALARSGQRSEAEGLAERLQWMGGERYVSRSFTAFVHLELGDVEEALADLYAADAARCPWLFQVLRDPRLKSLRQTEGFAPLQLVLDEASRDPGRSKASQHAETTNS